MKYTRKPSGMVGGYIHLSPSHVSEYTLRPPLQVLQLVYFLKHLEYLQYMPHCITRLIVATIMGNIVCSACFKGFE